MLQTAASLISSQPTFNPGSTQGHVRHAPNRLFQVSTMSAILDSVYDGDVTIADLLEHGNFGIGTFNALDGEMVINEGVVYQLRSDGGAVSVPRDSMTPFACMTYFEPQQHLVIDGPIDKAGLESLVNKTLGNQNLFAAIRYIGAFARVDTRAVFYQSHPYPPMVDVVRQQPTKRFGDSRGVMLGFRAPGYMQGLNVAGYHLHFLTEDQKRGGHVTDYQLSGGHLEIVLISDVTIQLPLTKQFSEADLAPENLHEAIRFAEGD
jgi:acetolactate decarboxylase